MTGGWAYMRQGTIAARSHSHYWRDGFTVSLCGQATEPHSTLERHRPGHRFPDDCHQCHVHLDKLTRA